MINLCKNPVLVISLILAFSACKKDEKSDSSDTGGDKTEEIPPEQLAVSDKPDTIDDLRLSTLLNMTVPDQVEGKGAGVSMAEAGQLAVELTTQKRVKSYYACEMRYRMRENIEPLKELAVEVCYAEEDAKDLKLGNKVKFDYGEGETFSFWIDNSGESIIFHMCENDVPSMRAVITGLSKGRSKGTIHIRNKYQYSDDLSLQGDEYEDDLDGDFGGSTTKEEYNYSGSFDFRYTNPRRTKLNAKGAYYTESQNGFVSEELTHLVANLHSTKTSFVKVTSSGFTEGEEDNSAFEEYVESYSSRMGLKLGTLLAMEVSTSEQFSEDFDVTELDTDITGYAAFYDNAGNVFSRTDSPLFQKATSQLTAKDLPKPLPRSFVMPVLGEGAGDWDCSGAVHIDELGDQVLSEEENQDFVSDIEDDEFALISGYERCDALDAAYQLYVEETDELAETCDTLAENDAATAAVEIPIKAVDLPADLGYEADPEDDDEIEDEAN
jgi:hypothetical protein